MSACACVQSINDVFHAVHPKIITKKHENIDNVPEGEKGEVESNVGGRT